MSVLVTGGAGFIGRHLVDLLVEVGSPVTVLDNLDPQVHGPDAALPESLSRHVVSGAVRFILGDVADSGPLDKSLEGVTTVVHLAAAVGVGQSMYRPYYYVRANSLATGALLEAMVERRAALNKLVVASSMSIYGEGSYSCASCGGREPTPRMTARLAAGQFEVQCANCRSDMDPEPTTERKVAEIASVYAATKKHQEDLFVAFGSGYRIPTLALRFFNVYGPGQSLSNPYTGVAAIFLSRLLNGEQPLIFEDGEQTRDFIQVRDVARALLLAVRSSHPGVEVLNVGTGRRVPVREVAEVLARSLGLGTTPHRLNRFRAGDVRHCYADVTRIHDRLGFRASIGLESGLQELAAASRDQRPKDLVEIGLRELQERGLVG